MSICWWRLTTSIRWRVPSYILLTTGLLVVIKYHNVQVWLVHLLIEIVIEFILCYSNLFTFFNQFILLDNLKTNNRLFQIISKFGFYYKLTFVIWLDYLFWILIYWLYDYKIGLFYSFLIIFSFSLKEMTFSPNFYKAFERM